MKKNVESSYMSVFQTVVILLVVFIIGFLVWNLYRGIASMREGVFEITVEEMNIGSIQIEKAGGSENETLNVFIANNDQARLTGFSNVDAETIAESKILMVYAPATSSSPQVVEDYEGPVDLMFFSANGNLLKYYQPELGTSERFYPGERYAYVIKVGRGLIEEKYGIAIADISRLVPSSLETVARRVRN